MGTPYVDPKIRIARKCRRKGGCLVWQGTRTKLGYGQIWLRGRLEYAHRAVWMLYVGNIPEGMFVCHRCDNPSCCRVEHLFLGTNAANMADMVSKGRQPCGRRIPHARLTEPLVRDIRAARAKGEGYAALGRRFGVSPGCVWNACNGASWNHVR